MTDDEAFTRLVERHRRELGVHCYRMLGSFEESQDLVQETFLRAWRGRGGFTGEGTARAWLYRIATNACLDFLDRNPRPRLPDDPGDPICPVAVPWLQPYPDRLLDEVAAADAGPDAVVVAKETVELAFLAALQYLPPRERAVLILRDVLGWPARETATHLGVSTAAVNSAAQRARLGLRARLPRRRADWARGADPGCGEPAVLRRYMEALERADDDAVAAVLREDARTGHQGGAGGHVAAEPGWYRGRAAIVKAWAPVLHGPDARALRFLPVRANRQPAVGTYAGEGGRYRPFALNVLRIEDGAIAEITTFDARLFPLFDLPESL